MAYAQNFLKQKVFYILYETDEVLYNKNVYMYVKMNCVSTLYFCYCRQCVHRDLAARNVMVQKNENEEEMVAKIADFGLSR